MTTTATSELPNDFTEIQKLINDFLVDYCQKKSQEADTLHSNYGRLWKAIATHADAGGKRLRPYLVVLTYEAFGGTDRQAILQVAAAWELIHMAMLMHDDIIDRDYVRHGHPNVAGLYLSHYDSIEDEKTRQRFANDSALLAGDLLISGAYELLFNSDLSADVVHGACQILNDAIFSTVGGELLDIENSALHTTISPELIAKAKTAGYSLVGPLLTGATLAHASQPTKDQLRTLGVTLGVGFQYADDVLGIFGDAEMTGKSVLSDLEEGKRTFVVAEALELMTEVDRSRAEQLLQNPSPTTTLELRELIVRTDVQTVATGRLESYFESACKLIDELDIAPSKRTVFVGLASMLLRRRA